MSELNFTEQPLFSHPVIAPFGDYYSLRDNLHPADVFVLWGHDDETLPLVVHLPADYVLDTRLGERTVAR